MFTIVAVFLVIKVTDTLYAAPLDGGKSQRQSLRIIEQAVQTITERNEVNKNADRICASEVPSTLFCILASASIDQIGHYEHHSIAMDAVRGAIYEHFPDRWTSHPIMDFNNHSDTTVADMLFILELSRQQISQ